MALFGKIANYNEMTGSGFLLPDGGGDRIPFAKTGLAQASQIPSEKDRYQYDTESGQTGETCAVNLRKA